MVRRVAIYTILAFFMLAAGADALALDAGAAGTAAGAAPDSALALSPASQPALPTVDANDLGGITKYIVQAIRESRWAWLVGLLFMLATWAVNRLFKERIPKKVLPWVAIGLGVGTNIALCLAGGMVWYEAIGQGLSLGMAASGGWSAFGKHLFPTS